MSYFWNRKRRGLAPRIHYVCAGFTIPELIIVLGIIAALAVLTIPLGVNFYREQLLDETAQDILLALRRAQNQAVTQRSDSKFGINFSAEPGVYILFQGDSYATRLQAADEKFYRPLGVSVFGISEVVFEKLSGQPNTFGVVTVSSLGNSKQININAQGKIERQ